MSNPVDRFSSRIADYDKYRPSYPLDLINKLLEHLTSFLYMVKSSLSTSRPFLLGQFVVNKVFKRDR